ncbi:MAG TPA: DUF4190 domain-containing protein [Actinotalea sp.]|nr:DUF4190 domain-containing protein [Actinotalea sp.]
MSQPTPPPNDPNAAGQPYGQPAPQPYGQPAPYGQPMPQPYAQGYPQQGYAYGAPQTNNSLAIVSLIAGIVGLTVVPFIGSIVAVITGHMAKKQIAQTGEGGGGLATGGLVTGYIGIALSIIAIIAIIAFWGLFAAAVSTGTVTYN